MGKIFLILIIGIYFVLTIDCHSVYAIRPLSTEDASVPDKGAIEAEIGFEYTTQSGDNNYNITIVPIYGLTENVQLCAEIPIDILRPHNDSDEEGLGDIKLASKFLIIKETDEIPAILFKTIVKLATGDEDKGLGSGDEDVTLLGAITKSVNKLTVHGNIGYTFVGKDWDSSLNDYMLYGIAFEYSVIPEISVVGEIYGESESDFDSDSHTITPLIGLFYGLTEKIRLDTAFKISTSYEKKLEYGIIGGISISF